MKTEPLKIPCTFEEREPLLIGPLLFIPKYYFKHEEFNFSLDQIYPEKRGVVVEYCSGNGDWIIEKATQDPDRLYIAVEIRMDRVKKIWSKLHQSNLKNLFIVFGDARVFAAHYLPKASVDESYVNFPDPWPKKRHAKHRLIQKEFVELVSKSLQSSGELILATDHKEYRDQMIDEVMHTKLFASKWPSPYYKTDWQGYGASFFKELFIHQGEEIFYLCFIKND